MTNSKRKAGRVSDGDSSEGEVQEIVETTFSIDDPSDAAYHGIKMLITQNSFTIPKLNQIGLAQIISDQGNIGCVVVPDAETDETPNVVGLVTILNLAQYSQTLQPVADYALALAKKYGEADVIDEFERVLAEDKEPNENGGKNLKNSVKNGEKNSVKNNGINGEKNSVKNNGINSGKNSGKNNGMNSGKNSGKNNGTNSGKNSEINNGLNSGKNSGNNSVGWLFSTRVKNLPDQIIPDLAQAVLIDDVAWSQNAVEMEEDERPFYYFSHLLFFATCYRDARESAEEYLYPHFEDEVLMEFSTGLTMPLNRKVALESPKKSKKIGPQFLEEFLKVGILPYEHAPKVVEKIRQKWITKAAA